MQGKAIRLIAPAVRLMCQFIFRVCNLGVSLIGRANSRSSRTSPDFHSTELSIHAATSPAHPTIQTRPFCFEPDAATYHTAAKSQKSQQPKKASYRPIQRLTRARGMDPTNSICVQKHMYTHLIFFCPARPPFSAPGQRS